MEFINSQLTCKAAINFGQYISYGQRLLKQDSGTVEVRSRQTAKQDVSCDVGVNRPIAT